MTGEDGAGDASTSGPLSGSYHQQHHASQSPKYSPSNSVSGPQSLVESGEGLPPRPPAGATAAGSAHEAQHRVAATSNGDEKAGSALGKVSFEDSADFRDFFLVQFTEINETETN
jgi:hypothetical protein